LWISPVRFLHPFPGVRKYRLENQNMKTPRLGRRVMRAIGRQLRKLYADIIAEGVPERFATILRRLDDPNSQDEPTPPAAPAASSEQVSRDDGNGIENGGETHESFGASPRALRWFAFGFARAALIELVPTELAVA
jgi:hypothetical protein